jgi:mono/diheme cytochrome c family protein
MKNLMSLVLLLLATACLPKFAATELNFSEGNGFNQPVTEDLTPFQQIMKDQCLSCHAKTLEDPVRLDKWMNAVGAENSRMYKSVFEGRMPKGKPPLSTADLEVIKNAVTNYQVREKILVPHCLSCHTKTLNDPERFARWVVPGSPEESKLYLSVKSGRMPKDKPPLTEREIEILKHYIENLR